MLSTPGGRPPQGRGLSTFERPAPGDRAPQVMDGYSYSLLSAAAEAPRGAVLCVWAVVAECSVPRPTRGTGPPEPCHRQLGGTPAGRRGGVCTAAVAEHMPLFV